jgi:hypothetical protein
MYKTPPMTSLPLLSLSFLTAQGNWRSYVHSAGLRLGLKTASHSVRFSKVTNNHEQKVENELD